MKRWYRRPWQYQVLPEQQQLKKEKRRKKKLEERKEDGWSYQCWLHETWRARLLVLLSHLCGPRLMCCKGVDDP